MITPDRMRPGIPYGVQSGDVSGDRAVIWSRTDRPARLIVEYATTDTFTNARRVTGPAALPESDFTARVDLSRLPAGQEMFYRVTFQDLANPKVLSAPVGGRFRTPPTGRRTITFAWAGDEAGQGWGTNTTWGGMKLYEVMRQASPDFFIHSGDQGRARPQPRRAQGYLRSLGQRGKRRPVRPRARAGQSALAHQERPDHQRGVGDGATEVMTVSLHDLKGGALFRVSLNPEA